MSSLSRYIVGHLKERIMPPGEILGTQPYQEAFPVEIAVKGHHLFVVSHSTNKSNRLTFVVNNSSQSFETPLSQYMQTLLYLNCER